MLKMLLAGLICFNFLFATAQQQDYMAKAQRFLKSNLHPKQKTDSLNKLAFACVKSDTDAALKIVKWADEISLKSNYANGIGTSCYLKSRIEERIGNIEKASELNQKALAAIKDSAVLASCYIFDGWLYRRLSQKEKSIVASMKGLKIAEAIKSDKLMGDAYNTIGALYVGEEDYKKAKYYQQLALKHRRLTGNEKSVAASLGNLGIICLREEKFDQAINYHQQALKIFKALKDTSEIAFVYNDLGATYSQKGDQPRGIKYLKESIRLREQMNESNELAYTYNYLGEAYNRQGNFLEAEKWIKKALAFAIEIHNNKQNLEALQSVSDFYASNKKADSAYKYLKLYKLFADSLSKIDRTKTIDELTTKYETEKKEQQIQILNQDKELQTLEIESKNYMIGVILVLILATVLFAGFTLQKRKSKEKITLQQEIIKQQDIATKAVLDAEEKERRRISGDLHDGVGQMLSASLLNLNSFYQGIKSKLSSEEETKAKTTIELLTDSYDEMRSVSHQMMPNALLKSGLSVAIREFLNKIESEQLKVSLSVNGLSQRLDEQIETVMYRVVQECVNNIIKHAKADRISIQISKDEDGINCTVEDNGIGFNPKTKFKGIGLSNMQSRIAFLKGEVEIESAEGKGTLVNIFIPLKD